MFAQLAVGVSAQLLDMENRVITANNDGGIRGTVEIVGQDDDERLAMRVMMQLDRPVRPQLCDHRGDVLALLL
jgi:hypothetical protein